MLNNTLTRGDRCYSAPAMPLRAALRIPLETIPSSQVSDDGEHVFSKPPQLTKFSLDSSIKNSKKNGKNGEGSIGRRSALPTAPGGSARPIKRVSLVRASMGSTIAGNVGSAPQLRLIDAARKTMCAPLRTRCVCVCTGGLRFLDGACVRVCLSLWWVRACLYMRTRE